MSAHFTGIGVGVALVTPFNQKGEVDYPALERLLRHVSEGGVDYLVALGTTAETPTLSVEEKEDIVSFIKANNPHKLPIVLGLGGNHTSDIIERISLSDLSGISAILSVSPYYNKPTQEGIFRHYSAIADASPVPVILYNVPGRTGSNIQAETTLKLAIHPNIIGIKESTSDLAQVIQIAKNKPADFALISGDDSYSLPFISFGGSGTISVIANAVPELFSQIIKNALISDLHNATSAFFKISDLIPLIFEEGNPVGVKALLHIMDICTDEVRLPLVKASSSLKKKLEVYTHQYFNSLFPLVR